METLAFVLGSLSGLFLIGMVYSFLGVLKMSKRIKDLQDQLNDICREMDKISDNVWRDMDKRFTEHENHSDYLVNEINRKTDELNRYIDSRLDKTVDVLCTRMDAVMDEHKKEFEHVHLHIK